MIPTPTQYVAALKAEGLSLTAHPGWAETDRPGPWAPYGVAVHHTGPMSTTAAMIDLLRKGRSDLPGPLCHAGARKTGIIDLVGWQDTNHAGLVDPLVLSAIRQGTPAPAPRSGGDSADGNAALYGIECYNDGDGRDPWPARQVDAIVRYCAALCRMHGWNENHVVYHKGLTTRKVDPKGLMSITSLRAKVRDQIGRRSERLYTIRDGDSPRDVAERFDLSVQRLWNANSSIRWRLTTKPRKRAIRSCWRSSSSLLNSTILPQRSQMRWSWCFFSALS